MPWPQTIVPKFGDWDNNDQLSYSMVFDKAHADKESSKDSSSYDAYHNALDLNNTNVAASLHENMFSSSEMVNGKRLPHGYQDKRAGLENSDFGQSRESQAVNARMAGRMQQASNRRSSLMPPLGPPRQFVPVVAPREPKSIDDYSYASGHPSDSVYEAYHERPRSKSASSPGLERRFHGSSAEANLASAKLAGSNRSSESERALDVHEKTAVPRFGDWDASDASSGEGFTVIFNRARDEKKSKSSTKTSMQLASPGPPDEDLYKPSYSEVTTSQGKKRGSKTLFCCVFP